MRWFTAQVIDCRDLGASYSLLVLGRCAALEGSRPGQFVMLRGNWGRDPILPRPYSILDVERDEALFLVRRVGRGSRLIAAAVPGDGFTVLGPLGTSFPDPPAAGSEEIDLLVAGGCGLPPLYRAAAVARRKGVGHRVELLYGARSGEELVLLDRISGWDLRVDTITEDGSGPGGKGLVTDLLERRLAALGQRCRVMACGPVAMLESVRVVARRHRVQCLLSLEAHMACGLGACLGCAVEGKQTPYLHVCRDGPVFDAEAVWPAASDAPRA
jgi:dihydroorotate dehydrogenase electron transfer subunit